MKPLDYGRSFCIGTAAWNEVRFWVESRTRIIDEATGDSKDYIQAASCKSENTFGEKDLLYQDNYDFLPFFGPEYTVVFRRKAWLNPNYREVRAMSETWGGIKYHLVEGGKCEELKTNKEVREATYAFTPIVAQTEIRDETTKLRAVIEYPVKTMNTRREDDMYQVDTGPLAFPDLSKRYGRTVDCLSPAFVVFNVPHFADFVVEGPTALRSEGAEGEEISKVYHYSRILSLKAENRLYAVC